MDVSYTKSIINYLITISKWKKKKKRCSSQSIDLLVHSVRNNVDFKLSIISF